jgi:hypothetical protein
MRLFVKRKEEIIPCGIFPSGLGFVKCRGNIFYEIRTTLYFLKDLKLSLILLFYEFEGADLFQTTINFFDI